MATRDQIEDLLFSHPDMTYQEIGKIVERSRQWVHQVARESGRTKKSRLQRRDITIERVLEFYYHSNLLIKDMPRMLGCNALTIRRRLRAGGISPGEAHSRKMKLRWLFKPKPGELVVVCAWCGREIRRKSGEGQTGISHGICPDCLQKLKERRE